MAKNVDAHRTPSMKYGKVVKHNRITPQRFVELLTDADLSQDDFALMWGTTPNRIQDWVDGRDDIPFPVSWALALLSKPDNFDEARRIVEPLTPVKPQYVQQGRSYAIIEALKKAISAEVGEAQRVAQVWEASNPGQHPNREALRRYETLNTQKGIMNISRQIGELQEIAGIIGLGIDVNAEIEKANAPFIEKINAERRQRTAAQRAAAPPLPTYRRGK